MDLMFDTYLFAFLIWSVVFYFANKYEDFILFAVSGWIAVPFGIYYLTQSGGMANVLTVTFWIGLGFVGLGAYCFGLAIMYAIKNFSTRK